MSVSGCASAEAGLGLEGRRLAVEEASEAVAEAGRAVGVARFRRSVSTVPERTARKAR